MEFNKRMVMQIGLLLCKKRGRINMVSLIVYLIFFDKIVPMIIEIIITTAKKPVTKSAFNMTIHFLSYLLLY